MRLRYYTAAMFALTLGLISESVQGLEDVVMHVSYDGSKYYILNITFTSEWFVKFYRCLCSGRRSSCSAKYTQDKYQVKEINYQTTSDENTSYCTLYMCKNSGKDTSVVCAWWKQQENTCGQLVKPTFISLNSITSCDASCVGVSWILEDEYLKINSPQLEYRPCKNECCSADSTLLPNYGTSPAANGSEWQAGSEEDYTETYIVSGIAVGIFFIAVVVFIIILLVYKRQTKRASEANTINHLPDRTAENTADGFHAMFHGNTAVSNNVPKHIKVLSKNTKMQHDQSKQNAGFGFSNVVLTPGQHNHNEEVGKAGKKSKDVEKNQKDTSKGWNFFTKTPTKSNKDTDLSSDESGNSSNDDEDYAVIDDSHIQTNDPSHQTSSGTEPASGNDPNDGYSSLEYPDYYNTREPDSSPGHSYTNTGEGAKDNRSAGEPVVRTNPDTSLTQNPHLPFRAQQPTQQFSEYSVARPISMDADVSTDTGQVDTSARILVTSSKDKHSADEPDNWRRLPLGQGHDNTAGDNPTGENKRRTYFELEQEDEDA